MTRLTNWADWVTTIVNIYEAKTNLSDLVERAVGGEEIVIAKAGVAKVKLVPVPQTGAVREPGLWKGQVWYSPDWNEPMTEEELLGEEEDPSAS